MEDVRFELCYVLRDSSLVLFSQAENTKNDLEQEISLCDHAVKYFNEFVDIAVRQVDEFWPTISIPKFFLVASKLYKRGCDREVPIEQAAGFLTLAEQLYRGAVHIYERFGNNKLKVSLFNLGVTIARRAVTKDCDEARGRYSKAEIRILYEQAIGYLMRSATLCMSLNGADDAERVTKEFLELPDVEGDKKPEDKSKIEGLEVITDIKEEPKIVDKEPKIGIEGPEIMDIEGFKRVRRALATTFYELGLVLLEQAQRAGNEEQMIDLFERSAERLSTAERMFLILHNEERAYHTNEHYLAPVLQRSSSLLLNRAERSQYFDEAIQLFEQAAKRFDELGLVLIRQARYASEGAKKAELYKQAEENFGRTAETYDTVIARCETYQDEKLNNRVQRDRLQSRITWGCALREHAEVVSDIDEQVALYRNAEEVLGTTLNELNKFKGEDDEIGDDLQATSAVYTDVLFKLGELLQKQAENAKTAEEKAELERQAEEYRLRADDFIRKFMGGEEQSQTSGQDIEKTVPEVDEPPPSPGMF